MAHVHWVAAIFYGLKPAVIAIVAAAVIRIGRKALKNEVMWSIAALAFVAIFFLKAPFPLIVLAAGVIGFVGGKFWESKFNVLAGQAAPERPIGPGRRNRIAVARPALMVARAAGRARLPDALVRAHHRDRVLVRHRVTLFFRKASFSARRRS